MKKIFLLLLLGTLLLGLAPAIGAQGGAGTAYAADAWGPLAGTDDLGRTLPQTASVGVPKANRTVALFYFLWQQRGSINPTNWVISDVVSSHPGVLSDMNSPYWYSAIGSGSMYYWGQPIYNYYDSSDYWVQLKNVQLLTDANVDILVIDATNAVTYSNVANILMNAIDAVKAQGKNPPKVVFYTNTNSGSTMQQIYNDFYKPGAPYAHPNSVYYLDGKPLIIGLSGQAAGHDYQSFFTYRESQWPNEGQKTNGWPWLEFVRPQRVYTNASGQREIVNVSVAQHPNGIFGDTALYGVPGAWGRSYHNGANGSEPADTPFGYNVQEQWDYAIAQQTPFIFVTGWNEWIAGRWDYGNGKSNFVDLATAEYSRDIEPTLTGNLKDNYYMQMVDNIRRYKGIEPIPTPSAAKTIASFGDWADVSPSYRDYTGDTLARNSIAAPAGITYANNTGRNDFDTLKVSRDASNLYFYAKTAANVTANSGSNWMRLYLDIDHNPATGWKGYDYRVAGGSALQHYASGSWTSAGTVTYSVSGKEMMITIPRSAVGSPADPLQFEFKWSDNMQTDTDPLDWYVNGDAAPGARLSFTYSTATPAALPAVSNGSFETPAISGFQYNPSGSGWTFDPGFTGIEHNGSAFGAPNAPDGTQAAILQRTGSFNQAVNFPASGTFQISFSAAKRAGNDQTVKVYIDSTLIATVTPTNTSAFTAYKTSPFTVTAGSHTVKFAGQSADDNTAFVDQVAVQALPVVANAGFETPAVPTLQYNPSGSGWIFDSGYAGIEHNGSAFGAPNAPEGTQAAFVQRSGFVKQNVTFPAAGSFKVTFSAAKRPGDGDQTLKVYMDSTLIGTFTPTNTSAFAAFETSGFTATPGVHTITFAGQAVPDCTDFIDQVAVVLN
ncbi:DUF642 domain-containing protein [Paenibacillus sacheonensis]|uniref:DUF642 domain-containing protein n=1 Tax=Paenibacillus sacheonensis TaxID=742054 RepID=A0A7X4YK59_9BACL|nr:DUF642 domain-containing protein [Paenibacillus sacheonensis]MBM7563853.1 hypothetical protein [Paenibacillus sacheonensis]NBC67798.1 DUF642 domain-containing protein [Paenibacillus sacheonensis]